MLSNLEIEAHLSALAAAPVRIFRRDNGGALVLVGATDKLAAMCGFKAAGRTYFTATKVAALLQASPAMAVAS